MIQLAPTAASGVAAACPICSGTRSKQRLVIRRHGEFSICYCGQCDFAFASPRPTPQELTEFYGSRYFERTESDTVGYANYRGLAEFNAKQNWHRFKRSAAARAVSTRLILDVGCATGGFLSQARADGWDCVGVELSAEATEVAILEYGLDVHHGDVWCPALEQYRFGAVTMWHVLEHLIDPLAALERVNELLPPGGILFIELPNWNSLGRRVRGAEWSALTPPEHINFFTPTSLADAVTRTGFEVIERNTHYPSMIDRARVRRPSRPYHIAIAGVAQVSSVLGAGGYIRVTARKPA